MLHRLIPVRSTWLLILASLALPALGPAPGQEPPRGIRERFTKLEQAIPMRDGVKLFTSIYVPKDTTRKHPFLMMRTPYSVAPYGADAYRTNLGPNNNLQAEDYVFVYQDVRGRYLSEGTFENMTPHKDVKKGPQDVDESSDTYDTIDWLLKNVPNNNGRVGLYGISYPGFYSSAGMIDAHPALKAVSPQAPIADWFFDDFRHHGALFLPHAFNFLSGFGKPRPQPTTQGSPGFRHPSPDGYQFFLDIGPMKNVDARYFKGEVAYWNTLMEHPNYDAYWEAHNLLPHLKKVAPAVMTVGGWYDAEDLYGTFKTYQAVEKQNPGIYNVLVVGPWRHGGWSRTTGDRLGNVSFGGPTANYYRDQLETAFFNDKLLDKGTMPAGEAFVFETGANRWRTFDRWPPAAAKPRTVYLRANGGLGFDPPVEGEPPDAYVSDPRKPVPFTEEITPRMTVEYMTDDQRFAARRPDVLVYQTPALDEALTLAGPIYADLWVSTTGTDADWVVKVIDVFPGDAPDTPGMGQRRPMGGYQMMVRSEILRGRFRNSYAKPEPFVPDQPTHLRLELQDVLHTFGRGHRLMVQIQSSWFPLADRNPQKFVPNINFADDQDFITATHKVYHVPQQASKLEVAVVPPPAP